MICHSITHGYSWLWLKGSIFRSTSFFLVRTNQIITHKHLVRFVVDKALPLSFLGYQDPIQGPFSILAFPGSIQ